MMDVKEGAPRFSAGTDIWSSRKTKHKDNTNFTPEERMEQSGKKVLAYGIGNCEEFTDLLLACAPVAVRRARAVLHP